MPGFTSYDDIITEMTTNGKRNTIPFAKVGVAGLVGVWESLWTAVGIPGAGSAPAGTTGTSYSKDNGSINFPDVSTDLRYLLSFGATATQNCTLMLYDRLVGVSGISVASTGNKTVNSTAVPRYSGTAAVGNQVWLEVTTATTTTAAVVSLNSYTNEGGTAGRAGGSLTFPAAATVLSSLVGPLPLQAGDLGVRSVEVGLNVGTAASAGVVNVLIIRPIAFLPIIANVWNEVDLVLQLTQLERLFDGATLGLAMLHTVTTATNVWGKLITGHG